MLVGMNLNVVNLILGNWSVIEAIVYILVGVSAVIALFGCKCKNCKVGGGSNNMSSGNM